MIHQNAQQAQCFLNTLISFVQINSLCLKGYHGNWVIYQISPNKKTVFSQIWGTLAHQKTTSSKLFTNML